MDEPVLQEFTLRYLEMHKVRILAESMSEAEVEAKKLLATKPAGSRLLDLYKGENPEAA